MKRTILEFLVVMAMLAAVLAPVICRGAEATLETPGQIEVGELLRLDPGESVGDHFTWLVEPPSEDFHVEHDVAFFSARRPGRVVFILIVSDAGGIATSRSAVTVRGNAPGPGQEESLAERVRKLAKGLPVDERAVVAKIHSELAVLIDNVAYISSAALFVERAKRKDEAFPNGQSPEWKAFFFALDGKYPDIMGLLDEYDKYIPIGKDGPASDFSEPFRQVAEGLR